MLEIDAAAHDLFLLKWQAGFSDGYAHCDRCGAEIGEYTEVDGMRLCEDCMSERIGELAPAYTDDFLKENPDDRWIYATEVLADCLSDREKRDLRRAILSMIETMIEAKAAGHPEERAFLEALKSGYCLSCDGFYEYVRGKL